jgi:xanthine phosphoribosyltransferase
VFWEDGLKALEDAIRQWGKGIGTDIVKVDYFLNHRIDTALSVQMGQEIADYFRDDRPSLILTVEASGIALAITAAQALGNIPVVFAKKHPASNQQGDMYTENVTSFTKGVCYQMRCAAHCIHQGARVLIVDDFLADGEAIRGMLSLIRQAGAKPVGVAVAIEKAFQKGGRTLREAGVKVLSLAAVREIRDGHILFQEG